MLEEIYTKSNSDDESFYVGEYLQDFLTFSLYEAIDQQGRYSGIVCIQKDCIIKKEKDTEYLSFKEKYQGKRS
ncbi:MAG: hypothetical protein LBI13_07115 [Streptococcaceae bacterium]|jgi:hypothetical protein|nr:hypothetical protein [Streptococcaceae bacterium]